MVKKKNVRIRPQGDDDYGTVLHPETNASQVKVSENEDLVTTLQKKADKTYVDQEIENIPEVDISGKLGKTHVAELMPHQFTDGAKTYKWGFRTKNGQAQFIYEEVL